MGIVSKKFIFLIFVTIFLTSCSVEWFIIRPSKNTSVTEDYPDNKKGLVIVRMLSPMIVGWKYYSLNDNRNYKKSEMDDISMTVGPGNYQVLMLNPGIYSAAYFQDNYIAYSRPIAFKGETLLSNGMPTTGAFEVRSGVVSYVGDLEFRDYVTLNVKDNFEDAKLFFRKNYPKINSPMIKNLAYNKFGKTHE